MPRATFLLVAVAASVLTAFACGEGDNESAGSAQATRKPAPTAAPVPYKTIAAGASCTARDMKPDLDPFYCWAIDVGGVVVAASAAVDPKTVNTAAATVAEMLGFRDDIRERLASSARRSSSSASMS